VGRHLVLPEANGAFSIHPAVRDYFYRLAVAGQQAGWHDLLREQMVNLIQQPGLRLQFFQTKMERRRRGHSQPKPVNGRGFVKLQILPIRRFVMHQSDSTQRCPLLSPPKRAISWIGYAVREYAGEGRK
jgi:hypothetical protein